MSGLEADPMWTTAIAILGSGGGVAALWRGLHTTMARMAIVESATKDHGKKLERASKKIADVHTSVEVLAATTQGLEKKIDEIGKGQGKIFDHILNAK